jgi:hypothetical protein
MTRLVTTKAKKAFLYHLLIAPHPPWPFLPFVFWTPQEHAVLFVLQHAVMALIPQTLVGLLMLAHVV